MSERFTAPQEIRDEPGEVAVGAGATGKVVEIVMPAGADGIITGFGHDFGAAGAFGSTILWSIQINGAGADQWTRFYLQRGTFSEPVNPQVYIPPGGRASVEVVNGTVAGINARARLRVNVTTKRGVRAADILQEQGGSGSGTGGGSSPPAGGGGGGGGGGGKEVPPTDGEGGGTPVLVE